MSGAVKNSAVADSGGVQGPRVLDIIRTASQDCRVQGNTMAANELLDAVGMVRDLLEALIEAVEFLESWNDLSGGKAYRMGVAAIAAATKATP